MTRAWLARLHLMTAYAGLRGMRRVVLLSLRPCSTVHSKRSLSYVWLPSRLQALVPRHIPAESYSAALAKYAEYMRGARDPRAFREQYADNHRSVGAAEVGGCFVCAPVFIGWVFCCVVCCVCCLSADWQCVAVLACRHMLHCDRRGVASQHPPTTGPSNSAINSFNRERQSSQHSDGVAPCWQLHYSLDVPGTIGHHSQT